MKELFREPDLTRVSYFQALVEDAGIPTIIRNQQLTFSGLTEIPIPEFYPALCVLEDSDYDAAVGIIRAALAESKKEPGPDITCPSCGEACPGNFDQCWNCGDPLPDPAEGPPPA